MTQLVSLSAVSVHFNVGGGLFARKKILRAADGVDLQIDDNETLALVGESGSGKTTLGRVIAGLQKPSAGEVAFRGAPLTLSGRIQMVFQDPFSSLDPRMLVSDIVAEPLRLMGTGTKQERLERVQQVIEQVRLPAEALQRYPHEFSGGQRQRIAIARALAAEPELIVADEPLSALDVSIQSQVLNLMMDLRAQRKLSYLLISHDLAVVRHIADRVAVLYLGRLVELAPADALFARPSHPYTQALLAAAPRIGQRRARAQAALKGEIPSSVDVPPGCPFHTRCPKAQDVCRTLNPALEPAPGRPGHWAACHFKE